MTFTFYAFTLSACCHLGSLNARLVKIMIILQRGYKSM
jgi:hypothetical protein